jgi:hypothetical protein
MALRLEVHEESALPAEEVAQFDCPLIENAACYMARPTPQVRLAFATVRSGPELLGLAPLVIVDGYRGTRLLKDEARRWLDPLVGPFSRKTTCLVDTSFMGSLYEPPFFARRAEDRSAVREAVITYLKGREDIDTVIVTEPAGNPEAMAACGFQPFLQLPLVRVDVGGCGSFDQYLQRLPAKRRRNVRHDREVFAKAGARFRHHEPPLDRELAGRLHQCLLASAQRNANLEIPYGALLNDFGAFCAQRQWVITAWLDDALVGFFAYIPRRGVMHQCHGGMDYARSYEVKAYPNLMHAAVETAIDQGFREVTFGPLNNEAKRRAGELVPVMSSFRCRSRLTQVFMTKVLMPRFQVYTGSAFADDRPDQPEATQKASV